MLDGYLKEKERRGSVMSVCLARSRNAVSGRQRPFACLSSCFFLRPEFYSVLPAAIYVHKPVDPESYMVDVGRRSEHDTGNRSE